MSSPSPLGVLWDIGNVIVRWDPRNLYSKIFQDPRECERFLAEICTAKWHHQADLGRPMQDGCADLAAKHPRHAAQILAWHERWWEMFSGPIAQTTQAIEALADRGIPQFALSNMPPGVRERLFNFDPAFDHLAGVVLSCDVGVTKPSPEIYALACQCAGLAPQELLFIDDLATNIEAAQALGFQVHLFDDPNALQPALARLQLL